MIDAQAFKTAFEQAQEDNSKAPKSAEEETSAAATAGDESVDKSDDEEEEKKVDKVESSEGQTDAAKVSKRSVGIWDKRRGGWLIQDPLCCFRERKLLLRARRAKNPSSPN
jgi:hypothetical protein